jgi:hypothetical protein
MVRFRDPVPFETPGSGSWILDPGWGKKFGSGINISDPQHWKATIQYFGALAVTRTSLSFFFVTRPKVVFTSVVDPKLFIPDPTSEMFRNRIIFSTVFQILFF